MNAKIGFACGRIPYKIGCPLIGYDTKRLSTGIQSDLSIKVVLIDDGRLSAFIALDTLAVDEMFTQSIAKHLERFGLSSDRLIVCASHTHSGNGGLIDTRQGCLKGLESVFGTYDEALVQQTLDEIERLFEQALETSSPFVYRSGTRRVEGVAGQRHDPKRIYDDQVSVLEVLTDRHETLLFTHHACHPTILDRTNTLISADLPGAVASALTGHADLVFFANGSAGDLSTRFTRSTSDAAQLERFGKILSEAILDAVKGKPYRQLEHLTFQTFDVKLALKPRLSKTDAQKALDLAQAAYEEALSMGKSQSEMRLLGSKLEGARSALAMSVSTDLNDPFVLSLTAVTLDDLRFITIPGELFSSLQEALRKDPGLIVLGYTNGYVLYLPDRRAFEEETYEALSALIAKGEGETLIEAIRIKIDL